MNLDSLRPRWSCSRLMPELALVLLTAVAAPGQPLDTALNAGANAEVLALALQADGKILVGGSFTTLGGLPRSRLARINPDGTVDASFSPAVNSTVSAILVQPDGRILIGGSFTSIGATIRGYIARLNADGSVETAFAQGANNRVSSFALQPDGRILVAGTFTQLGGQPRDRLGRLNGDGSLDPSFRVAIIGINDGTSLAAVYAVLLQSDGRILIGGNFLGVASETQSGIARLNPDGSLERGFNPGINGAVSAFAFLPDGSLLIGGGFTRVSNQIRNYLARLKPDGSLDPSEPMPPNGPVRAIAVQTDGKILLGGSFTGIGPNGANRLVRLNVATAHDITFLPRIDGTIGTVPAGVYALLLPGPGQIVAGGAFSSASGFERNGLARFGSPLPFIAEQPVSLFAAPNSPVTFSVDAAGPNLRYQWKRDGVDVTGATGSALPIAGIQAANGGAYTVTVTNSLGSVTSSPAVLALGIPPATTYNSHTLAGVAGQAGPPYNFLNRPLGITVSEDGTVFFLDGPNNLIRYTSSEPPVQSRQAPPLTGIAGWGLALDRGGNIYVADADTRIARVTRAGFVSTYAGVPTRGSRDGPAATAQFRVPRGVAVDATGNVFVADSDNVTIRKISPSLQVTTIAGLAGAQGLTDGTGSAARFYAPWSLALDEAGNLFVADRVTVRKVSPSGSVTTLAPIGSVGDAMGVAADSAGNVFVADANGHVIRRITSRGEISVIAGQPASAGSADGPGGASRFNAPWNIAIDTNGNLFVTDNGNSTVRRLTPDTLPLAIISPPSAQHAIAGSRAELTVAATGIQLRYQWKKDGVEIAGATQATYTVTATTSADTAFYTVVVRSAGSAIESPPALLTVSAPGNTSRLINVATRGFIEPGGALTPGFVLRGAGPKQLLVRGVGPTLLRFGLGGSLADPRFELAALGAPSLLTNDDWSAASGTLAAASAAVGAFPLDPLSKDAAALTTLNPTGLAPGYTVRVTGPDATASGLALAEIYDADPLTSPVQLVNVSTRGFVGAGANALVPGFVIGGSGPLQLLIRAIGPGLAPFGVTGLLADPQLTVAPLGKEPVAANDNWGGTEALRVAFAAAGAFNLPLDSKDAVVLLHLPPGAYTVTVSGVAGTTGTALVEIYDVL